MDRESAFDVLTLGSTGGFIIIFLVINMFDYFLFYLFVKKYLTLFDFLCSIYLINLMKLNFVNLYYVIFTFVSFKC